MRNALRVFLRDLKRLAKTPAAWSVVLFLTVLPSLYTWFNVEAFWNPYDNTGNLRVCVVNEDAGTYDETLGKLNLGEQITESLEENDQLSWQFVSREEAEDEVRSGRAYAAFVIPETFSADITTVLTGEFTQPTLEYYVNEKTGPVAPKITDTGATTLDTTINDEFFSAVSSTVAESLNERLGEAGMNLSNARSSASSHISNALDDTADARKALADLRQTTQDARGKAQTARSSLDEASKQLSDLSEALAATSNLTSKANTGLFQVTGEINTSLNSTSTQLSKVSSETAQAITLTAAAIEAAKAAISLPVDPSSDLGKLLASLDRASAAAANSVEPVDQLVQSTLKTTDEYRSTLSSTTIPQLGSSLSQISAASADMSTTVANQKLLIKQASLVLDELDATLATSTDALDKTDRVLADMEADLKLMLTDVQALGQSSMLSKLVDKGGIDPDKVAEFMLSPTQVQSEVLYPLNAYGSAMAPLFINLTLWIGVFMLMVIIRVEVDDEEIEKLTSMQRFIGRGLLLSCMAAAQAIVCCAGCLILGVQSANVVVLFLTAIIASLAYLSIQYTLSTTLQHVGKALCIILVFVQIPGATGLYPVEMTPQFFQTIYPLFPFTYGINAMREAICGFYGMHWLSYVGVLAGFWAAFIVIGLVVRPYLTNLNRMFARQIEESDIINGEAVELPARRWRLSQIIRTLTERDEYRQLADRRAKQFVSLDRRAHRIAGAVSVGVPILVTLILALAGVDKVIVLTTWLIWFAIVAAFFVIVEYVYDSIIHQVSLESMSDEEIRQLYTGRDRLTRVMPVSNLFEQPGYAHVSGYPAAPPAKPAAEAPAAGAPATADAPADDADGVEGGAR